MKIKMLNNETINKIAAGEVIIRPVSVVKELMENAIDAGADQIVIIIEAGGKNRITVRDNGCGISYDDLPLAFKRHATSKLDTIEDLENINSLGFRGEALSSVSAVAKVQIITRNDPEELGSLAIFDGGKLINQRVCAYNRGTEITVRDLFFNTPARRKHMEKDKKEELIVRDLAQKIAISHSGIRIQVNCNDRIVLDTKGTGNVIDVVKELYGVDIANNLIPLDYENKPMKLTGFVGNLKTLRNHREDQIFFINGRYIKNNHLAQALDEAYEGYCMKHQHPMGIIFIELPGRMLDVNIHPAKTEIKILNESLVCLLFKQGIRETLRNANLIVDVGGEATQTETLTENKSAAIQTEKAQHREAIDRDSATKNNERSDHLENDSSDQITFENVDNTTALEALKKSVSGEKHKLKQPLNQRVDLVKPHPDFDHCFEETDLENKKTTMIEINKVNNDKNSSEKKPNDTLSNHNNRIAEERSEFQAETNNPRPMKKRVEDLVKMKIVGQLFNVYILLEGEKEIYLLDQHAAHEAFLTKELLDIFDRGEGLPSQGLMTADALKFHPKDLEQVEAKLEDYRKLGFDCDIFGADTLLVRSVPVLLGEPQSADLLKKMIDENIFINDDESLSKSMFSKKMKNKIISMACKAAIKGGQPLTQREIKKLLENLMALENPYTCPHGRPIIMRLKEYELMKLFKRVV
ncbi:DNA mismatch repair endonuclease MutL [Acetobacterium woodii]|uniref:DNA mismatch repair protein MutL n=1 Tax=Acetobacterium woodii (strain ATCC 29683 / DSM 1030 / JCM 2381 / KCTC 1655 / WB1) TaxID=931626 RepID=H6LC37_ACEWD|nr:DNA mismatch repair endonuclease MutL [Acetobacterium woodii]AFA48985.1 DNA mismatch repair protein MutL [Acetobacterium woodii DSM 1030]